MRDASYLGASAVILQGYYGGRRGGRGRPDGRMLVFEQQHKGKLDEYSGHECTIFKTLTSCSTHWINEVHIEAVTQLLDAGRDLVEHHGFPPPICKGKAV